MDEKPIPRWQQGLRPFSQGDVWDAMSPRERRNAFIGDLLIVMAAITLLGFVSAWQSHSVQEFWAIFTPILKTLFVLVLVLVALTWVGSRVKK